MPAPAPTAPAAGGETSGPDLTIFLLAHRAFRLEFARLAKACVDRELTDLRRRAIDNQIALMARSLHAHHADEDATIYPLLRRRDPAAAVVLDALERDHARIDPLIAAITDTSVTLPHRAPLLIELSDLLNAHLDEEEAGAVPLMRRHYTGKEWDDYSKLHIKEVRKDLSSFVPTMIEHMSAAEADHLFATAPKPLVLLYKYVWGPRRAKIRPLIYGE